MDMQEESGSSSAPFKNRPGSIYTYQTENLNLTQNASHSLVGSNEACIAIIFLEQSKHNPDRHESSNYGVALDD